MTDTYKFTDKDGREVRVLRAGDGFGSRMAADGTVQHWVGDPPFSEKVEDHPVEVEITDCDLIELVNESGAKLLKLASKFAAALEEYGVPPRNNKWHTVSFSIKFDEHGMWLIEDTVIVEVPIPETT